MVNNVPNQENPEGYEFKEDQGDTSYQYSEQSPNASPVAGAGKFKRRPVVTAIVSIVVLALLWEIFHVLFSSPAQLSQAQPTTPPPSSSSSTSAPSPTTSPTTFATLQAEVNQGTGSATATPSLPAPVDSQAIRKLNNSLKSQLQTVQTQNQQVVQQLEQQQTNNQMQMSAIQTQLQQLSTSINQLNQTVGVLNEREAAAEQTQKDKIKAAVVQAQKERAALRAQKNYFVVAVIPGRAWLKATDGTSISVTRGENLPGYGTVLSIDPYSGMVQTTYAILQYATE